jgi:uncharacterized protein (TIGR03437 family)
MGMVWYHFLSFVLGKKREPNMKNIVSIAALMAASLPVVQADVITAWTFENNSIAVNNIPAPSTGSGTATSIGMATYPTPSVGVTTDDVLAGTAGDTGVNGVADTSQIWRVRAQAGTSGAANGWSSAAPIGSQGAMFAVSTVGYTNITVSFDWYATNQGEANLQLQYTADGATWHNVALYPGTSPGIAVMNNTTSANTVKGWYVSITGGVGQGWFAGLTAAINDPTAAHNPKFAIQIVNASTGADCISASGTPLNNNSGNWRFDNVVISGQSTFTGFTPGNLVLSRSVYTGDKNTVVKGQALPPVCPASANTAAPGACAGKASNNGAYASTDSADNTFNNDTVDGSFGITAPIFLDQLTPSGATINSFAVPSNMVVTSFSSKSELALNLSTDGSVLTFMGYIAAPNTVDVSNSNTPMVYDPTNAVGGSYFRAVVQVGANGAIQVTPINAYSGNNGRAAILADGQYYMVGNSNNGAGTPDNVVSATGVEIATPGQAANTVPQEIGSFSISQINPLTGQVYAVDPKDKPGKDNNFRGLTIFNNTLYVTKGSGSNGIDTVYQVGNAGSLPTPANAASAPIAPLPGFPTISARLVGATDNYPFGIWFANATTLYVADEGDGVMADAAGSTTAGLQKWILSGGTWKMAYVLQKGLNLGQPYSIANYPTALNPATAGLRNLTGKVNGDGTVTLYAVTSTVSTNGDQGADPNKLVSITDTLANTTAAGTASETFATLRTAAAGEVLRGIAFAPSSTWMLNAPLILSAASPSVTSIAQGGLVFATGQKLAPTAPQILGPSPTAFDGVSVTIGDSAGNITSAPLVFVSPSQVTFQVPSSVAAGMASVTVSAPGSIQTANNVVIASVAPAVLTVNGNALVAGYAVRVSNGTQTMEPAYVLNSQGSFSAAPINMGSATDQVHLTFYATGVQAAGVANVTVTVNGVNTPVLNVGNAATAGIDQVDVLLPAALAGSGTVALQVTASGIAANAVQIAIQ